MDPQTGEGGGGGGGLPICTFEGLKATCAPIVVMTQRLDYVMLNGEFWWMAYFICREKVYHIRVHVDANFKCISLGLLVKDMVKTSHVQNVPTK